MSDTIFEIWAVVDLFGHTKVAGKVSEQQLGGKGFIRIDVPATPSQPEHTRFYGPAAIYSIIPVDEQVARAVAAQLYPLDIVPITAPVRQLTDLDDEIGDEDNDDDDLSF